MLNKQSYVKSCGYDLEWSYQYDPRMSLTLKYFLDLFTPTTKPRNKDQPNNNEQPYCPYCGL